MSEAFIDGCGRGPDRSRGETAGLPVDGARGGSRTLRVGVINIMPRAEAYEPFLTRPLGRSGLPVEPVWIRLRSHAYGSSDRENLERNYVHFEDALGDGPLDGLVLTGAPVEELPFEEVEYWDELTGILGYARAAIRSTLGLCWGGLALAKLLGLEKTNYTRKIFGIFETRNLDPGHFVTGGMDDVFWCPQSRFSGIADDALEEAGRRGTVSLLAHAPEAGYTIFESGDGRFLMHLGHPEYEAFRLVEEYRRDLACGKPGVEPPRNLDVDRPLNRWRTHGSEFFGRWLMRLV